MLLLRTTCLITALLLASMTSNAQNVVVNSDNTLEFISRNTARAIFSMRLEQWPDGSPITVYVLADNSKSHRSFTRDKLSMFPHQLRRSWDRYVYSGIGSAPIEVGDEQEMLSRVASTPGAIGYLNEELSNDDIRSLAIQ